MEKFQPACRDRNLTRVKNETRAHCLEMQRMSNSDIFVPVAGMECSYGEIFIPPTEISPLHHSFISFSFIFNSLYRVKTSITKVTALQLALSTKQKPIYNFMSQLTYKKNIE